MPVDLDRCRNAFQKLERQLAKLAKDPAPESVHKFRTYSRRVEAFLQEMVPARSRSNRKLLKMLARARKRAGRVRDLDVQIAALRSLRIPQEAGRKAQFLRTLIDERNRREKKLGKTFSSDVVREMQKRLKRAAPKAASVKGTEPLQQARQQMERLGSELRPSEKTLHTYRVAGKRARYLAEFAGDGDEARQFVELLKGMQDAIGDWHDWWKMTARAEKLFGGAQESALVAALRNVTRAKFRHALDALSQTRSALAGKLSARKAMAPAVRISPAA